MSSNAFSADALPAPEIPVRITSSFFDFLFTFPSRAAPDPLAREFACGGAMGSSYTLSCPMRPMLRTRAGHQRYGFGSMEPPRAPSDRRAADAAQTTRPADCERSADRGLEIPRPSLLPRWSSASMQLPHRSTGYAVRPPRCSPETSAPESMS